MNEIPEIKVDPPVIVPPDADAPLRGMAPFVIGAALVGLATVVMTKAAPGPADHFVVGLLLGTSWGETTVAAAWFALGPGKFPVRALGSFAWVVAIVTAFAASVLRHSGGGDMDVVVSVSICVAAQWLLLQIPLWTLRLRFGFALETGETAGGGRLQFGMRHLLIFTALIGVALGAGRALITTFSWRGVGHEAPIFAMLTVSAILTTLPLVLSIFIRRYAVAAVGVALLFIAAMIPAQLQFVAALRTGGPDVKHLLWINAFQVGWIGILAGIVRLYGYRLTRA